MDWVEVAALKALRDEVARLRAPSHHCHWDAGKTECGHPTLPYLADDDDAEWCPYCGGQIEFWVTMGIPAT